MLSIIKPGALNLLGRPVSFKAITVVSDNNYTLFVVLAASGSSYSSHWMQL